MKIFALILILFMTTFAFGQENKNILVPIDTKFIINPFNPEECEISYDYDSIFIASNWSSKESEYFHMRSSVAAYGYYRWQFYNSDTIKIIQGLHSNPFLGTNLDLNNTEILVYKFDSENNLLYVKDNYKYESVMKTYLYRYDDKDVLVLCTYYKAKWKTPVKKILKCKELHYQTLFRYKRNPNIEVQTNRKCDMNTIKMKLQDSWGMGKSYQSPATLEEKQQLQNLFNVDAANIGSAFVFESEKTRKEKIKKNNEEFAKLKEDEIISFNYPPQYSGNINIQLKEDDSFVITYTQERAAPHDGFYLATQIMKGNWNIVENILTLNITEQSFTKDSESQLLPIVFLNIPVSESLNKEITCNFSFHFEEENLILSPIDINTND